jgi:outer membrane protein TolC
VQQLDLNLGKIEIAVNNAKRQIEIARNMLKFQLGMPMKDELILTDDINTLITNAKLEISGRYTFDIKNNVQYRVADKWVEVRDMQIRLEKSKYLPSLNVFINQNWSSYEDSFTYFSSGTSWFDATKFGVNLVVPILSSNQRGARVQKARVISEKARVQREELAAGLQLQLSVANSNFNQAFASYQIAVKNVELATSIRNKTNIKFQEGIATSLEVTQAESQLISDKFNVIESALRLFEAKTKIDELLNN